MYLYSYFNLDNRGGGLSTQRYGLCTPRKGSWYPFYRELDGSQGRSGRVWELSPTLGFDYQTVYIVQKSRCTDYAIRTHFVTDLGLNLLNQLVYLLVSVTRIMALVIWVEWRKVRMKAVHERHSKQIAR